MAQVCSVGIDKVVTQVTEGKEWFDYNRDQNFIEVRVSPEKKISEYNIKAVARKVAASLNKAINSGLEIGDVFIPTKRDGKEGVLIAPSRIQLELLNSKDAKEQAELEAMLAEEQARGLQQREIERGDYDEDARGEFYQLSNDTVGSKASNQTVALMKDFLQRIGVKIQTLEKLQVNFKLN